MSVRHGTSTVASTVLSSSTDDRHQCITLNIRADSLAAAETVVTGSHSHKCQQTPTDRATPSYSITHRAEHKAAGR